MPERIPNGLAKKVVFRAIASSDHFTPKTAVVPVITISKNGGAFGNPNAGATNATEMTSGFYKFDLDATDTGTNGPLAWRAAVTGMDDVGDVYEVVNVTNAGFTALPNVASGSAGAVIISGTGTAALSVSSGLVTLAGVTHTGAVIPTVTTLTNLPAITANWLTAAGMDTTASAEIADAVWDEAQADHVAAGSFGVTASEIADILVDTAEIGAAGAGLTNIGTIATVTNLTNLPAITANWLTAAGTAADFGAEMATAVWTDTTAGDFTVAASIGKSVMNGVALGTGLTINAYTGNTVQTGDAFARLGAPAGASVSADVAAVKVDTAAILVDTGTTLDGRIPAALTAGGNMKVDVLAISGSTTAADNLEESTEAIAYGTVDGTGATTTAFLSSALTPDSVTNDQFNGRVLIFKADTTTTALRGQATTISDYVHTSAEIGTFTVVALTTAPQTGDTFTIL